MPPKKKAVVVIDTSVLMAQAQPWEIDELATLSSATEFVIPGIVLWELDGLARQPAKQAKARAALKVLRGVVDRGGARKAVSCGNGRTIRIAAIDDEDVEPPLSRSVPDDRILALALSFTGTESISLATSDFAMYAKALALGLEGRFLDSLEHELMAVTVRDRLRFDGSWRRVEAASARWEVCRRGLSWLVTPLAASVLRSVEETGDPVGVAAVLTRFNSLRDQWTPTVILDQLLKPIFGLDAPQGPDYQVLNLKVPGKPPALGLRAEEMQPSVRPESPEERVLRIASWERSARERDSFIVDTIFDQLELVREFILEEIEDPD